MVISNVPGPTAHLYNNGAKLEAVYPVSMLWDRQAINFTMFSYVDTLFIGMIATDDVDDVGRLSDDILEEFEALR